MESSHKKILELVYKWYKESGPAFIASKQAIEEEAEMTGAEVESSVRYLIDNGYLELWRLGDCVRITRKGIKFFLENERT